jgi:6-phosphogluconolactonase
VTKIEAFANADEAAHAAADAIVAQLRPRGPKRLLVTGGRGPGPVFDRLAKTDLDWTRVTVTLSDDRFVGADSPDSNERLARRRLLQDHAAGARFVALKGAGPTPADDAAAVEPKIAELLPFDAAILGMGDDGHIASLFPNMEGIAEALDPASETLAIGVTHAGMPPYLPRISLTARALFDAALIVLLVGGDGKKALIERVLTDPSFSPPVSALLRQTQSPVRILWSPGAA